MTSIMSASWRLSAFFCLLIPAYGRMEALDYDMLFRDDLSDQEIIRVFIESTNDEAGEKLAQMAISGEYHKIPMTTLKILCFESAINDTTGHVPFAQKLIFLDKLCEVAEVYYPLGRTILSRRFGERYCRELADLKPQDKPSLKHIDFKRFDVCVLEFQKTGKLVTENIILAPPKDMRREILEWKFPVKGNP